MASSKELNNNGVNLLNEGKIEEAIKFFEEAINLGENMEIESWLNKGRALKKLNKFTEAIECFNKAQAIEKEKIFFMKNNNLQNENILLQQLNFNKPEDKSDNIEELCHQLNTSNEFDPARIEIIEILGKFKDPKSVPYLIKALEQDYAVGRDKIAIILSEMEIFEAIPVLTGLLNKDKDTKVRVSAVKGLGLLSAKNSIDSLIKSLKEDPSEEVRYEAAEALKQFEDIPEISAKLKGFNETYNLLHRLKDGTDIEEILKEFNDNNTAEKILLEALKDDDREDFNIIKALSYLGSQKAIDPLIRVLKNKNNPDEVRACAAQALGNLESKESIEPLLKVLKDDSPEVRIKSVEAIGKIKEKRASETLITALNEAKGEYREIIIQSLGKIGYLPPLLKALKDRREHIRSAVIEALGNIKNQETIKSITKLLREEDRTIKNNVLKILSKQEAFQELINALENSQIRDKSLEILISSENTKLIDLLMKNINNPKDKIRGDIIEILGTRRIEGAIDYIIKMINDSSTYVSHKSIEALGKFGKIEVLIKTMEKYPGLKPKIIEAIATWGEEKDYPVFIKALKDDNPAIRSQAVRGLSKLKTQEAVKYLVEMLKDSDKGVRSGACVSLGIINNQAAITPLCTALKDKEDSVRETAKITLEQLSLNNNLKDIIISNLKKISSFSITSLFSQEEKIAREEARNLLKTIHILDS